MTRTLNTPTGLPELLEDLCLLLLTSGDVDGAERLYEGLAEVGGQRPGTWMVGGFVAFARSQFSEAEACYRQVLAVRPHDLGARCFLAEALIAQQRLTDAGAVLDSVESAPQAALRPTELAFAAALREGLTSGLFRRSTELPRQRRIELR
jgi:tetratricopeptide (TPR) repeat protein